MWLIFLKCFRENIFDISVNLMHIFVLYRKYFDCHQFCRFLGIIRGVFSTIFSSLVMSLFYFHKSNFYETAIKGRSCILYRSREGTNKLGNNFSSEFQPLSNFCLYSVCCALSQPQIPIKSVSYFYPWYFVALSRNKLPGMFFTG